MRIAFSARGLSISSGGARQFIKSLIPALAECRGDDELFFFYSREQFRGLAADCPEIVMESRNKMWWDFVLLPRMLRKLKIEAAIFPKNVIPPLTGCANYVVIHDLAYFLPELNAYPLVRHDLYADPPSPLGPKGRRRVRRQREYQAGYRSLHGLRPGEDHRHLRGGRSGLSSNRRSGSPAGS